MNTSSLYKYLEIYDRHIGYASSILGKVKTNDLIERFKKEAIEQTCSNSDYIYFKLNDCIEHYLKTGKHLL